MVVIMKLGINKFVNKCNERGCKFWEFKSPERYMCKDCYDMYLDDIVKYDLIMGSCCKGGR